MALGARNKAMFVDGTYPEIDRNHSDYGSWSRCNNIVCTWLVNAVDKPIARSIMYLDTTHQMWRDIHDQFKQSDGPRTADIKQQIFAEVQGTQRISDYYTKLKQLWEELKNHDSPYTCCCGSPECASSKHIAQRDEQDKVLKFLMGLNDSFTATRGQIFMMEPKPTLTKVFNLCSQEERQRSMKSTSNMVFQASQDTIQTDSIVATYSGGYNKQKTRRIRSHCGLLGHTVNRCYNLHGYPPGYKIPSSVNRNQQSQQQNQSQQRTSQSKSLQSWSSKRDNMANLVSQDSGCISMHDHNDVHLGSVTTDQIQKLLSVLNTKPVSEQISQVSGSTLQL